MDRKLLPATILLQWKRTVKDLQVVRVGLLVPGPAERLWGSGAGTVCAVPRKQSRTWRWACSAECTSNSPTPGCPDLRLHTGSAAAGCRVPSLTVSGDRSSCWSSGAALQVSCGIDAAFPRIRRADRSDGQRSWRGYSVGTTSRCPLCWGGATTTGRRIGAAGPHRWSSGGHQLH